MHYIKVRSWSVFTNSFYYFDKEPYLSEKIFEDNGIFVYKKPCRLNDIEYDLIFAKILKKDTDKFIKSMEELKNKMLICSHPDYIKVCDETITEILSYINEPKVKKLK